MSGAFKFSFGAALLFVSSIAMADGTFYFAFGFNRDFYAPSTLHYKSDSGNDDFAIHGMKAHDRPQYSKLFSGALSVPQYSWRLGYLFGDENDLGIEINFDHAKYVMTNDQVAKVTGTIAGVDHDEKMTINFLKYEHTNGANFLLFNGVKRQRLIDLGNEHHVLAALYKAGAGFPVPKTDSTFDGKRLDAPFHIAGYLLGLEATLRYECYSNFFVDFAMKGVYGNFFDIIVATGKAHQQIWAGELTLTLGSRFDI